MSSPITEKTEMRYSNYTYMVKTTRQEQQTQENSHDMATPKSSRPYNHICEPGEQRRAWFTQVGNGLGTVDGSHSYFTQWSLKLRGFLSGFTDTKLSFQGAMEKKYQLPSQFRFCSSLIFTTWATSPSHSSISWYLSTSFYLLTQYPPTLSAIPPHRKPHRRLHDWDVRTIVCLFVFLIWTVNYKNKCA